VFSRFFSAFPDAQANFPYGVIPYGADFGVRGELWPLRVRPEPQIPRACDVLKSFFFFLYSFPSFNLSTTFKESNEQLENL
jgi:hypothetical protein